MDLRCWGGVGGDRWKGWKETLKKTTPLFGWLAGWLLKIRGEQIWMTHDDSMFWCFVDVCDFVVVLVLLVVVVVVVVVCCWKNLVWNLLVVACDFLFVWFFWPGFGKGCLKSPYIVWLYFHYTPVNLDSWLDHGPEMKISFLLETGILQPAMWSFTRGYPYHPGSHCSWWIKRSLVALHPSMPESFKSSASWTSSSTWIIRTFSKWGFPKMVLPNNHGFSY